MKAIWLILALLSLFLSFAISAKLGNKIGKKKKYFILEEWIVVIIFIVLSFLFIFGVLKGIYAMLIMAFLTLLLLVYEIKELMKIEDTKHRSVELKIRLFERFGLILFFLFIFLLIHF